MLKNKYDLTLCQSLLHIASETFVRHKKKISVFASITCILIGKDDKYKYKYLWLWSMLKTVVQLCVFHTEWELIIIDQQISILATNYILQCYKYIHKTLLLSFMIYNIIVLLYF